MLAYSKYQCATCKGDHPSLIEAHQCHGQDKIKVKHFCGSCHRERDAYDEAIICCTDYRIVGNELVFERKHHLKTWPEQYQAVISGQKQFEIRINDRDYRVGDFLVLKEFNPETQEFTGAKATFKVTYLLPGGQFGLPENVCVMSIAK